MWRGPGRACEIVATRIAQLTRTFTDDTDLALLQVDLKNAFNCIDRATMLQTIQAKCPDPLEWAYVTYDQHGHVYCGETLLSLQQRVQQGDPLFLPSLAGRH